MIYPDDFEAKIGFAPLRALLKERCVSELGKKNCDKMRFMSDFSQVSLALRMTAEMLTLMRSAAGLPSENMHDMVPALAALSVQGNFLSAKELYRLRTSLKTIAEIKHFFTSEDRDENLSFPLLSQEFAGIELFAELEHLIDGIVNRFAEISDNASPVLSDIRRSISSASASLSTVMRRVLERAVASGIVEPDTTPSMRDGRLVIPVASSHKRSLQGIVHDESATGKTTYIEPVEVVAASNRLRELHEQEKREIHRILVDVANFIRPLIPALISSYEKLGVYDFIRAKAILANDLDAQMPILEQNAEIDWYGAVHPVLALTLKAQGKAVVPLDLKLDSKNRILIISGPNAGGKSVCLKTTGVVQYMLQCGLLPTLYYNSHVSVFKDICIDIGDEQSLENDLSTYSSHLRNMKFLLQHSNDRMLVLVDEMGSGTEPQIGGALAQAIIAKLNQSNVMGVITTHYQNLKTYADNTPGLINGAMLYDRHLMEPTFKLAIGSAGSSFALDIAHKIGLPADVIADAKEIVGTDYVNIDKYLIEIARDRRYWQNKRQNIREKESKLDAAIDNYEGQISELKSKRREIISQARSEAREILSSSNRVVERTILEIRKAQAEKERTKVLRRELDEYKKKISEEIVEHSAVDLPNIKHKKDTRRKEKEKSLQDKKTANSPKHALSVGAYVRMSQGGTVGKVLSINGAGAEVAFGAMRMRLPLKQLIAADAPKPAAASQVSSIAAQTTDSSRARQLNFKQDIDLRGMRADEALQAVTYFLDDASQFGISRVRILHGTGTGALRMAIRNYLQSVDYVKSFRDEDVRFGGAGITVVDLV